jgi:hypothetical protein
LPSLEPGKKKRYGQKVFFVAARHRHRFVKRSTFFFSLTFSHFQLIKIEHQTSKMKFTIVALTGFATAANAFAPSAFMGKTSMAVPKSTSALDMKYKIAVVGGGPSGACAAEIFAQESSIETFLFERKMDNAKPCGGAIPLCMIGEFDIPESVVDRKVRLQSSSNVISDVNTTKMF